MTQKNRAYFIKKRDLDGSTFYVPSDTTYEQWKQMQDAKYGAGSVNEISHHHLIFGHSDEYEVILQNNSEYVIIEAQYYKDKLFLVVEWLGG